MPDLARIRLLKEFRNRWFLYGSGIKIIHPKTAMQYMKDQLKSAIDLYDPDK